MKSYKLVWALAALLLVSGWTTQVTRADEVEAVDEDDEYEDVDRAHLIVRKWTKDELIVAGRRVNVTMDIFNAGAASAKNIRILDSVPQGATIFEGAVEAEFPVLSSGSSLKHTYSIVFTTGGQGLALPIAQVTYDAEEGSTQIGYSTAMGLYVMTPVQQIQRYALIGGAYASLGIARTPTDWRNIAIVLGLVGAVVGGQAVMKSANKASVGRKRQRALRELEKSG